MSEWKPDRSGKYFTAVYRDLIPGDEVGAIVDHPKCVIMSWSNAVHDVEQLMNTPQRTWFGLMRGVRVDGNNVVISVKGKNDAARELCGELIKEMNK